MAFSPHNKITVILDDRYATEQIRSNLQNNLTNSDVIIAQIIGDALYDTLEGIHETNDRKIYGQEFTLEAMPGSITGSIIGSITGSITGTNSLPKSGKLIVHYFKNSDEPDSK